MFELLPIPRYPFRLYLTALGSLTTPVGGGGLSSLFRQASFAKSSPVIS